jgi:hypothetical protein
MTLDNFVVRVIGDILKKGMWLGIDAMAILYAMLSTKDVWRQQTQLPPVPQKAVWKYLTEWYATHNFSHMDQVPVFVFDSRRCQFKVRT